MFVRLRDLLLITARTDIYLNVGVGGYLWRALRGRVQDRWVLAAVRKLLPQFKCTRIPDWDCCFPLSLMKRSRTFCFIGFVSRSTNDSLSRCRAAMLTKNTPGLLIRRFACQASQFVLLVGVARCDQFTTRSWEKSIYKTKQRSTNLFSVYFSFPFGKGG